MKELILKVYKIQDMKSYIKEMTVMKKLQDEKNKFKNDKVNLEKFVGFPTSISFIEGQKSAEILMEALGPNFRKLLRECPNSKFSKTTVYMLTIQLVSIHFTDFDVYKFYLFFIFCSIDSKDIINA